MEDQINKGFEILKELSPQLLDVGLKLLGAIAFWVIGGWIIGKVMNGIRRIFAAREIDATLQKYATDVIGALLKIGLVLAIAGYLGVNVATFAALLAGAGLAIGTAWGDILKNFAAGAFMLILRPIRVGDFVKAGGVVGTVEEVGIIVTIINSLDNVKHIVGNNKIFSDTIVNYSSNDVRRVELLAQLNHGADHNAAIATLKSKLASIPNVASTPAPEVDILEFNLAGPVLAVRPYTNNANYWQVYFDTNKTIREELGSVPGVAVPQKHLHIQQG